MAKRTDKNSKGNRAKRAKPANRKRKPAKKKSSSGGGPSIASRLAALGSGRSREIGGVLALGASILLLASLASLQFGGGLLMGPFGRSFAVLAYSIFGMGAYVVAACVGVLAVRALMECEPVARFAHVAGGGLALLAIGVLAQLVAKSYVVAGYGPGGVVGAHFAEGARDVVSTAGTALFALIALLIAVVIATPLRMQTVVRFVVGAARKLGLGAFVGAKRVGHDAAAFSGEVIRAVLPERDHDEYLDEDEEWDEEEDDWEAQAREEDPPIIDARTGPIPVAVGEDAGDTEKVDVQHFADGEGEAEAISTETKKKKSAKKSKKAKTTTLAGIGQEQQIVEDEAEELEEESAETKTKTAAKSKADKEEPADPVIVESPYKEKAKERAKKGKEEKAESAEDKLDFIRLHDGEYSLPALDLLAFDEARDEGFDKSAMLELSAKLVQTLENYGVKGHVAAIRPGPVVTMYEFAPAPGTRLNKIVNLSDDLAMSLEAMKVRIVAPLPGKAAVGIEVPNKSTEMVYLKEIIDDDGFRSPKINLPMALGKNIEGAPISVDLAKMPHLLVAGTTGSGKSVSVNSMITSLLYSRSPEEVRMIMIDPKMLELSIYEGIPHLLLPVVTDPQKANLALRWAVDEMERRYGLLAKMGVRDIRSYNKKLGKERAKWEAERLQRMADDAKRMADEGEFDHVEVTEVGQAELPFDATSEEGPGKDLPFIVVIIDEFADLMMCAPKEVETSVARIAQKARAAGIHLILATQRPSVDVITGLIKANFPSRIGFRVSSKVDSRTILDQPGAENLLGSGDMLFSDRGAAPVRLHGCFVDEDEIHGVVDFLKTQGQPVYNLDIVKPREEDEALEPGSEDEPRDELYDRAVQIIAEAQRVSVSYLQRRLSVGYNRSAKLVERMEREGVVSAPDNKKQREVLIAAA